MSDMYRITRRSRPPNILRPDVAICKWSTARHKTVFEANTSGLEECLSVIPKSICPVKTKGRLLNANEAPSKGYFSRNLAQSNQLCSNSRASTISSNLSKDGQVVTFNNRSTIHSKSTRETEHSKLSLQDRDNSTLKRILPQNPKGVSRLKPAHLRTEHNTTVHAEDGSSKQMPEIDSYTALKINSDCICTDRTSKAPEVETVKRFSLPRKCTRNLGTGNTKPQNLTLSLFQRSHKEATSLNNNDEMYIHTPKSKTSSIRLRCKTSVGHCRTVPEHRTLRTTKSAGFLRCRQGTNREDSILKDSNMVELIAKLETFVTENNMHKFQSTILSWDIITRQRVVNYIDECNISSSVFFRACQLSRIAFVTLMLKECSVDLEQTGTFYVPDDNSMLQVTPLWHAAASNNFDLVRQLTSFKANINAISSNGCSVIRAACCVSSVPIVAYLIAKGADIHAKNFSGVTCLMNAVMSPEIIKLLVHHGSKITEADIRGNTVLHYAAESGRLDTVKLLVEMGANPMTANKENCRAVLTAAMHGQREVVDYLLKVAAPKLEEIVDIFLVLGSVCIIVDYDYSNGYLYWIKAFELKRLWNKVSVTQCHRSVLADYVNMKELTKVEELLRNGYDHQTLCLQALLIYERIRGAIDDNFLNLLMCTGATCADNRNYKLATILWKTAYKLRLDNCTHIISSNGSTDLFGNGIMNNLRYLLKILHLISQEKNLIGHSDHNQKQEFISEDIFRDLFGIVCHHIFSASGVLNEKKAAVKKFRQPFVFLVKASLSLCYGYLTIFPTATRSSELGIQFQKLIRLNPIGENNETLLHMCLDYQLFQPYEFNSPPTLTPRRWPSLVMLEVLLLLGADPLVRDSNGNTVLHLAVHRYRKGVPLDPSSVRMLLRLGVHADQINHQQETAADLLPPVDDLRQILQPVSLKCFAARIIVSHSIYYIGEVPKSLHSFIELHAG